jgi:predicted aldo/keto reductase-like oxidoreductase
MRSVSLGRTGLTVSQVGFGGIPITRRAFEDGVSVVRRALDAGITFLDTANAYLDSEEKIGRAIAGRQRQSLVIASKSAASTKQGILEHIDLSLRRLRTDYVDLYQLHNVSRPEAWEVISGSGGALEGLRSAVEAGKVRHVGLTSHSLDLTETLLATGFFETVMVPFNMIVQEAAEKTLPVARAKGIGVIAMKPMAGGQLEEANLPIRWLCQFPDVEVLVGFEREEEVDQVVQLAEASEPLTQAELEEIDRLRRETGRLFCRRCGYCQPCPQGIPVTNMMVFPSFMRRFGPEVAAQRFGAGFEKFHSCLDCGECEEKCPYHLPIRERLREIIVVYEGIRAGTHKDEKK